MNDSNTEHAESQLENSDGGTRNVDLIDPIVFFAPEDTTSVDEGVSQKQHGTRVLVDPIVFFTAEDTASADENVFKKQLGTRTLVDPIVFFTPGGTASMDGDDASGDAKQHPSADEEHLSRDVKLTTQTEQSLEESNLTPGQATGNDTALSLPKMPCTPASAGLTNFYQNIPQQNISDEGAFEAYALMEKTAANRNIAGYRGDLHLFNGRYYEKQSDAALEGTILDVCRREIQQKGRYQVTQNARRFMNIDRRLQVDEETADRDSKIVTFRNCNLDIHTGRTFPHSPNVFTTFALNCSYLGSGQRAACPLFDRLLWDATGGNSGLIERLWQIFGYCLVPDTAAKKGFLFQGVGDSGKTVISSFLESFFPFDRLSALSVHDLGRKFALSELEHVSLCVSPDMPATPLKEAAVGNIKALSGNDLVSGDRKYKSYAKFRFKGKFLMVSNHALLAKKREPALEKRIIAVPFCFAIPEDRQDKNLLEKLRGERDAVATKAIDAYFHLRSNNYAFAGDYRLNSASVLYEEGGLQQDMAEAVDAFVWNGFEPSENGGVFVADAHAVFVSRWGAVALNVFGQLFLESAERIWGASKTRKRRFGESNPTSFVNGIIMKGGVK